MLSTQLQERHKLYSPPEHWMNFTAVTVTWLHSFTSQTALPVIYIYHVPVCIISNTEAPKNKPIWEELQVAGKIKRYLLCKEVRSMYQYKNMSIHICIQISPPVSSHTKFETFYLIKMYQQSFTSMNLK